MLFSSDLVFPLKDECERANNTLEGIRAAAEEKVPVMAIVGPRDAETRKVSVRLHGKAENAGELGFDEFVKSVAEEATTRGACTLAQRMLA